jgi:peptide/nickel transport system permease protein
VAEAVTVQTKGHEFVSAARASGAGSWPIVRHHLLPNVLAPILVD